MFCARPLAPAARWPEDSSEEGHAWAVGPACLSFRSLRREPSSTVPSCRRQGRRARRVGLRPVSAPRPTIVSPACQQPRRGLRQACALAKGNRSDERAVRPRAGWALETDRLDDRALDRRRTTRAGRRGPNSPAVDDARDATNRHRRGERIARRHRWRRVVSKDDAEPNLLGVPPLFPFLPVSAGLVVRLETSTLGGQWRACSCLEPL